MCSCTFDFHWKYGESMPTIFEIRNNKLGFLETIEQIEIDFKIKWVNQLVKLIMLLSLILKSKSKSKHKYNNNGKGIFAV